HYVNDRKLTILRGSSGGNGGTGAYDTDSGVGEYGGGFASNKGAGSLGLRSGTGYDTFDHNGDEGITEVYKS
ncbi:hypothetical protein K7432_015061, partial [Basidiobolus ranarum]